MNGEPGQTTTSRGWMKPALIAGLLLVLGVFVYPVVMEILRGMGLVSRF